MTARSQVEKLRRAADRAARVARENKRLDYGLEDIEIDLRAPTGGRLRANAETPVTSERLVTVTNRWRAA